MVCNENGSVEDNLLDYSNETTWMNVSDVKQLLEDMEVEVEEGNKMKRRRAEKLEDRLKEVKKTRRVKIL